MSLRMSLARVLNTAGPTFRRFWVPVGLSVALTTTLILAMTGDYTSNDTLVKSSLSLMAGILAAWCAILFWEREPRQETRMDSQLTGNLLAIPAAGLFGVLTYLMLDEFSVVSISRHAAICMFLFLAFFVIPHFRKEGSLEMYVVRLFAHTFTSILFSAVMFVGLSAITFTVSSLFSLDISYKVYIRIWLVMAGFLAPFLFMAGIPKGTISANAEDYPKVLKNLVLFVVTPLLATYTLVLYVYFAKILVTRQWPVGLVSHLVLWYSMVSLALLFFIWPVSSSNRWGDAFSKYFPKAVIPLLLMMFASVGIRIQYYGITENRYYVLVFGLWVLGSMLYLILTKSRRSLVLPASLAVVVVLAVFGPWSSFTVSKLSQNQRFEGLLVKYGMLQKSSIMPAAQTVAPEDRREFAQILFYFDRNHELSDVRTLPDDFKMADFSTVFGFEYSEVAIPKTVRYVRYEAENQSLDISGYRYLFDYTRMPYDENRANSMSEGDIHVAYDRDTPKIEVTLNGNLEWDLSLSEYFSSLEPQYGETGTVDFRPEDMVLSADTPSLRIKLVITGLWGDFDTTDSRMSANQVLFFLLVGEK